MNSDRASEQKFQIVATLDEIHRAARRLLDSLTDVTLFLPKLDFSDGKTVDTAKEQLCELVSAGKDVHAASVTLARMMAEAGLEAKGVANEPAA